MKKEIHPTWYPNAVVTCACGNTFTTGSTVNVLHVDICNICHPLYTGTEKLIDTEGLVQKFQKRQQAFEKMKSEKTAKNKVQEVNEKESAARPRTLKEMLDYAKKHPSL